MIDVSCLIDVTSYMYIKRAKEVGRVDYLINVLDEDLVTVGNLMMNDCFEKIEELSKFSKEAQTIIFDDYSKRIESLIREKANVTKPFQGGFNMCLEMIARETNIDWDEVKWNNIESSMVVWVTKLNELDKESFGSLTTTPSIGFVTAQTVIFDDLDIHIYND